MAAGSGSCVYRSLLSGQVILSMEMGGKFESGIQKYSGKGLPKKS